MLKKVYIFIGTMLTTGVIVGVSYNIINANNISKQEIETAQQINYSE